MRVRVVPVEEHERDDAQRRDPEQPNPASIVPVEDVPKDSDEEEEGPE